MRREFYRSLLSVAMLAFMVGCSDSDGGADVESPEPDSGSGSVYDDFTSLTSVVEYKPAPGQFVGDDYWDSCEIAFSRLESKEYLSLGAWGGFVSVSFGASVINGDGFDIAIMGNPFTTSNEPGVVWVSVDENGNGLCDDVWYELKGSEQNSAETVRGYTKIYDGVDYTFSGTKLPNNAEEISTDYWSLSPFEWGYADNLSDTDYDGGYNLFDIDNAIDESGESVQLSSVDFVRVQSGVEATAGLLGEVSTEVLHFMARTHAN